MAYYFTLKEISCAITPFFIFTNGNVDNLHKEKLCHSVNCRNN